MNLPSAPSFRAEDFPGVQTEFLETLSRAFGEIHDALATVSSTTVSAGSFISAASGVSTVGLKNPLPAKPRHVNLTLRRDDLADFSAAWSWWWQMDGAQIRLSFIGLPTSTRHVYSCEVL